MKRLPYRLIKIRRSYSFKEIALTLHVHIRTVQDWRKEGMPVIDSATHPYLVDGGALKQFLADRSKSRKCSLLPHEFFCFRCGGATLSVPSAVTFEEKERRLGNSGAKQCIVRGVCNSCGRKLARLSSSAKVDSISEYYRSFENSTGNNDKERHV